MRRFLLLLALLVTAAPATADPVDDVMGIFRRLSAIYRPSGEEAAVRRWIHALVTDARARLWAHDPGVSTVQDTAGNLLVRVPATGRFRGRNLPALALQAHLDMVLAVRGTTAGVDLRPYFQNGVVIEETEGVFHSAGRRTTAGFDDGIGVAMALRYLMDPSLEHPPLELVFTVDEEVGFSGILNFALPLAARTLIGLDSEESDAIAIGSMAVTDVVIQGTLPTVPVETASLLQVAVTGLRGAHSGAGIHLPRINAVRLLAAFYTALSDRFAGVRLVSATSGDPVSLNKIPDSFRALLATPPAQRDAVAAMANEYLSSALRAVPEEHSATISIEPLYSQRGNDFALLPARARRLFETIGRLPYGPLRRGGDTLNGVLESSNIGALTVDILGGVSTVEIGTQPRTSDNERMAVRVQELRRQLRAVWDPTEAVRLESDRGQAPSWRARDESRLVSLARTLFPELRYYAEPGAIELSVLSTLFPTMDMAGLGIPVHDAHTPDESMPRAGLSRSVKRLDVLVQTQGDASNGTLTCPGVTAVAR